MGVGHAVSTNRHALSRGLRVGTLAFASAVLALVALPTGASADPCVPPSSCPLDETLGGIERAPGGVVFTATVTGVTPETGLVTFDVLAWYHRGRVRDLAPGVHPATISVSLGPKLAYVRPGGVIPAVMPPVGSRFLVAGTWSGPPRPVSPLRGVVANLEDPASAPWLAAAEARHLPVAPTPAPPWPLPLPFDAPWAILGATVAVLLLAAVVLESLADARDPLPAT